MLIAALMRFGVEVNELCQLNWIYIRAATATPTQSGLMAREERRKSANSPCWFTLSSTGITGGKKIQCVH